MSYITTVLIIVLAFLLPIAAGVLASISPLGARWVFPALAVAALVAVFRPLPIPLMRTRLGSVGLLYLCLWGAVLGFWLHTDAELAGLKKNDPEAYLEALRPRHGDDAWMTALAELKPEEHAAEIARRQQSQQRKKDRAPDTAASDPGKLAYTSAASTVEFSEIRTNMYKMTDVQWDQYTDRLRGTSVVWTGWVSDVKKQWFGRYKVLIDMDPPGSVSVQDVYLEDVPESAALYLDKDQKVRVTGVIPSVHSILGTSAITLREATVENGWD